MEVNERECWKRNAKVSRRPIWRITGLNVPSVKAVPSLTRPISRHTTWKFTHSGVRRAFSHLPLDSFSIFIWRSNTHPSSRSCKNEETKCITAWMKTVSSHSIRRKKGMDMDYWSMVSPHSVCKLMMIEEERWPEDSMIQLEWRRSKGRRDCQGIFDLAPNSNRNTDIVHYFVNDKSLMPPILNIVGLRIEYYLIGVFCRLETCSRWLNCGRKLETPSLEPQKSKVRSNLMEFVKISL